MAWRPVLTGGAQVEAVAVASEIVDWLVTLAPRDGSMSKGPFLADGDAGAALCLTACAAGLREGRYGPFATAYLDRARRAIETWPSTPALFTGFVGVAWALVSSGCHDGTTSGASEATGAEVGEDELGEVDDVLLTHVAATGASLMPDLISGVVGVGVYALARLPRTRARQVLSAVVDWLELSQVHTAVGVTWDYCPDGAPPGTGYDHNASSYPLGVAHGHAGVIALLARIYRHDIEGDRVAVLLEKAVEFLLAERHTDSSKGAFPPAVRESSEREPSNSSWCWGDPGIAVALFAAGQALGRAEWKRIALDAVLCAALYGVTSSDPQDASLCHGAAGLGHILNRFYQITGLSEFAECSRMWFRRTLAMHRAGDGNTGFLFRGRSRDAQGRPVLEPSFGFLMGSAGVAAALVAAATPIAPCWDAAMMIDIR